MTKHFCEKCGKEISLKGNDYGASRITFGRTPGEENGWHVEWTVRKEYNGKPDDLCASCVLELVNLAIELKTESSVI